MIVTDIGQSDGYNLSLTSTPPPDDPAAESTGAVPQAEPPADVAPVEAPEPSSPDDGGAKGVLRLLQAGHFRGVADLRLRINFHEDLAPAQTEATKATAVEAVQNLSAVVTAKLEEMASSAGLSEEDVAAVTEAKESFWEAVGDATESFLAAEGVAGQALVAALEEGHDSLATALESALAVGPTEEAAGVEEATTPEAALDVTAAIEGLRESFNLGITELTDALAPGSFLPEVSRPNGRGGAFEKFQAMYEELLGPESGTAPEPSESVDVEA